MPGHFQDENHRIPQMQELALGQCRTKIRTVVSGPVPGFFRVQKVMQVARGSQLLGLQGKQSRRTQINQRERIKRLTG